NRNRRKNVSAATQTHSGTSVTTAIDLRVFPRIFLCYRLSLSTFIRDFSGTVASNNRKPGIHIAWTTITYRSVVLMILAVAAIAFISMRFAFPQFTQTSLQKAGDVTSKLLERVAGMAPPAGTGVVTA